MVRLLIAGLIIAMGAVIAYLLWNRPGGEDTSRPEALCRSYLSPRLMNPETAQFVEFTPLSREDYVEGLIAIAVEGGMIPPDVAASARPAAERMTEGFADDMAARGARFYRYRVRAQNSRGDFVTSPYFCAATADECACLSAENYRRDIQP